VHKFGLGNREADPNRTTTFLEAVIVLAEQADIVFV
jgi:hypothetical protein